MECESIYCCHLAELLSKIFSIYQSASTSLKGYYPKLF
jgi:hypothetical protein